MPSYLMASSLHLNQWWLVANVFTPHTLEHYMTKLKPCHRHFSQYKLMCCRCLYEYLIIHRTIHSIHLSEQKANIQNRSLHTMHPKNYDFVRWCLISPIAFEFISSAIGQSYAVPVKQQEKVWIVNSRESIKLIIWPQQNRAHQNHVNIGNAWLYTHYNNNTCIIT